MTFPHIVRAVKVFTVGGEGVPIPGPFTPGSGDVVSGALFWLGLRAYSNASIGTNAIRLRRDSDQSESDFATVTGGGLNLTGITSFKGSANLFVTKLYDQTGNGHDFAQTTAANQPAFTLSGIGSLPVITTSSAQFLTNAAGIAGSVFPYTFSTVYNNAGGDGRIFYTAGFGVQVEPGTNGGATVPNTLFTYGGAFHVTSGIPDGVYHAAQAVFNGVSSDNNVDGVPDVADSGTNNVGSLLLNLLGDASLGFNGTSMEFGLWPSAFSSGQSSSMSANQHGYWGF